MPRTMLGMSSDDSDVPETTSVQQSVDAEKQMEKQKEYLAASRDPFSLIRIAVWALLGLGGLAGIVTTFMSPGGFGQSITNLIVNVAVTVAMVGALIFEFRLGDQGKEVIEEEMENPMLKGDSGFFMDPSAKKDEDGLPPAEE